jgi:DNA-binding FrmR family transcriptional regulator
MHHCGNRRKETLAHINRIQGQIEALKRIIDQGEECVKVATLATSIAKSFDALRFRALEGFLIHQFHAGSGPSVAKREQLRRLLSLYKK